MVTQTPIQNLKGQAGLLPSERTETRTGKDQDEVSFVDLLIVLAERKRLIFLVTIGFAIAAAIVSLLLPVSYTATVTLLPPQQSSSLGAQLASQLGSLGQVAAMAGGGSSLLKNPNELYVGMLRSRTIEDAMIERFGLMQEYHNKYLSDARKSFERHASVEGSGKDALIHITVEDHDPRRAAEIANGYVDQFRNLSQHLAITEAGQRRAFFEQQLKQANQNLANAEEALKLTQQKTGVIQLDSQARALIESAAGLRAQITAKEVQIQGMQTYATGQNAQLVEAQRELDSLRTQLARLGGSGDSTDSIIVPKGQMTESGLEYIRKLRDVKYYETIFDVLARQFEIAKLDEAKEGALIQVVDLAVPPDKKSFPRRGLIVLISTFVGLIAGLIIAFVQIILGRMKNDSEAALKLRSLRKALALRRQGGPA